MVGSGGKGEATAVVSADNKKIKKIRGLGGKGGGNEGKER